MVSTASLSVSIPPMPEPMSYADVVGVFFGYLQAGLGSGLLADGNGVMDKAVHTPDLFGRRIVFGVEVADFAGDLCIKALRVEAGDGADAGLALLWPPATSFQLSCPEATRHPCPLQLPCAAPNCPFLSSTQGRTLRYSTTFQQPIIAASTHNYTISDHRPPTTGANHKGTKSTKILLFVNHREHGEHGDHRV